MILYARQQKRHRCKEQTFGLCERRVGWDDLREEHWNMYIIICEIEPVQAQCMRQGAQGWCTGMTLRDGIGREVGQGFRMGRHVHSWVIHVDIWQKPPQCCKEMILQWLINLKKLTENLFLIIFIFVTCWNAANLHRRLFVVVYCCVWHFVTPWTAAH